jgi:hypothetical protein
MTRIKAPAKAGAFCCFHTRFFGVISELSNNLAQFSIQLEQMTNKRIPGK